MPSFSPPIRAILVVLVIGLGACKGGTEPIPPDKQVAIIDVTPKSRRMYIVGDSVKFSAALTTEAGTAGAGIEIGWVARDKSLLSVSSAGVAKSLKKGGSTYVVATAGGKSDSALVEVLATPCGSVTPTAMIIGQVVTDIGATGFCAGSATDAEYAAIVLNTSLSSLGSASVEVVGQGFGTPPVTSGAALGARAAFARPTGLLVADPRRRNAALEMRFREAEKRELSPLVESAQRWYKSRSTTALRNAAPPAVGDLISVNVGMANGCEQPPLTPTTTFRNARVAAVSASAIMLDDGQNPAGGFTDAEYQKLAVTFDTLIGPVDVQNFGAPTDLDANGKVIILMTRAINELTAAGSSSFTAGRTMSRDLLPRTAGGGKQGCAGSNVGEIFYMLTPDPNSTINGNQFTKDFVLQTAAATIAHEYQHMINFSRRMYLLGFTSEKWFDEIWVHEGLSHMAEELVYHRASGFPTRTNISVNEALTNSAARTAFIEYGIGNFGLYDAYAEEATTASPFRQVDDVATRGATWAFFRYAADQLNATDGDLWFRLVNSGLTGLNNVQTQFGFTTTAATQAMLRDFVISVYADDYLTANAAKYRQPSWNMRSIYQAFTSYPTFNYPLVSNKLVDNIAKASTLNAGGFGVYRFKGLVGSDSFIRVTGPSASAMPAGVTMAIIRTR